MRDEDASQLAQQISDGTYYQHARRWYSELFHAPMAERSYYIVIILLALINMFFAVDSFLGIFPIATKVPFITYSANVEEDLPRMLPIRADKKEDKNFAMMQFLLKSYVKTRESYDLSKYELRYRSVWSQSDGPVFDQYKTLMDTSNPYSPYRLYTDRARRVIEVDSITFPPVQDASSGRQAQIVFEASVRSLADDQEVSHSRWQADITFRYTPFTVDQTLDRDVWLARVFGLTEKAPKDSGVKGQVTPMTFKVYDYQAKELLE